MITVEEHVWLQCDWGWHDSAAIRTNRRWRWASAAAGTFGCEASGGPYPNADLLLFYCPLHRDEAKAFWRAEES